MIGPEEIRERLRPAIGYEVPVSIVVEPSEKRQSIGRTFRTDSDAEQLLAALVPIVTVLLEEAERATVTRTTGFESRGNHWTGAVMDLANGHRIAVGADGHRCHLEPLGNGVHALSCPTGEHMGGWRHPGGPHKMCGECG